MMMMMMMMMMMFRTRLPAFLHAILKFVNTVWVKVRVRELRTFASLYGGPKSSAWI